MDKEVKKALDALAGGPTRYLRLAAHVRATLVEEYIEGLLDENTRLVKSREMHERSAIEIQEQLNVLDNEHYFCKPTIKNLTTDKGQLVDENIELEEEVDNLTVEKVALQSRLDRITKAAEPFKVVYDQCLAMKKPNRQGQVEIFVTVRHYAYLAAAINSTGEEGDDTK